MTLTAMRAAEDPVAGGNPADCFRETSLFEVGKDVWPMDLPHLILHPENREPHEAIGVLKENSEIDCW